MTNHQIGAVVAVSADSLTVELEEFTPSPQARGVPDSMVVNVDSSSGPIPLLIGQPGSFVAVQIQTGRLLSIVTDIDMRERTPTRQETAAAKSAQVFLVDKPRRMISATPIGTIAPDQTFSVGADVLPTVSSPVFPVLPSDIDAIYSQHASASFSIGNLSLTPGQPAKINLNAFLSRHSALLGQTGSGKSWAVASLLQRIAQFPQATTVLLDMHGEYSTSFGSYAEVIHADQIELPYWLMNSEELLGLMIDRSEMAAPNQVAKFKELLQEAKEAHPENKRLGIPKITIDTPVFFDFKRILDEFERLDTEMVPGKSGLVKGPLNGQFTRLLMRINSRLNDKRYDLIFHPNTYNSSASMETLFRKILGKIASAEKKVVVIDISPIPFDVRSSTIGLIMRCLFDFGYWYKRVFANPIPIALFCDEAHIYLNERDPDCYPARIAAERIAKEGRKYGISINVISQRPREVSATILSQCQSFLCLRMTNPDDISYVRNVLPDSIRGVVGLFSILRRGEAILLGDSVIMPTRILLAQPDPKPTSNDVSFLQAWSQAPQPIDFNRVLTAWRNQKP